MLGGGVQDSSHEQENRGGCAAQRSCDALLSAQKVDMWGATIGTS